MGLTRNKNHCFKNNKQSSTNTISIVTKHYKEKNSTHFALRLMSQNRLAKPKIFSDTKTLEKKIFSKNRNFIVKSRNYFVTKMNKLRYFCWLAQIPCYMATFLSLRFQEGGLMKQFWLVSTEETLDGIFAHTMLSLTYAQLMDDVLIKFGEEI